MATERSKYLLSKRVVGKLLEISHVPNQSVPVPVLMDALAAALRRVQDEFYRNDDERIRAEIRTKFRDLLPPSL
jgi:hypothetical protein